MELIDDSKVDYSGVKKYEPSIVTNQVGYRTNAVKTAVFTDAVDEDNFSVINADTGKAVYTGSLGTETYSSFADEKSAQATFQGSHKRENIISPAEIWIIPILLKFRTMSMMQHSMTQ